MQINTVDTGTLVRIARQTRRMEAVPTGREAANYGGPCRDIVLSALFPVYLTQNGGADGDDGDVSGTAVFPTWTYDVFTDETLANQIGTEIDVIPHRLLQISVYPAAHGTARWNAGVLEIWTHDEHVDRDSCGPDDEEDE